MSAAEWIAKRRELLAAATEGPWAPEDVYGLVAPTKIDGYTHPVERAETIRQGAADDALIADARTALPAALAALEQVLALHPAGEHPTSSHYYCEPYECDQAGDGELLAHCDVCREWWPCSTVTAIAKALGVEP